METVLTQDVVRKLTRSEILLRRRKAKERFIRARKAEKGFARQLKQVATQVGNIVKGMAPKGAVQDLAQLMAALNKYAESLKPWAKAVADRWVGEIAKRDARAWNEASRELGYSLKKDLMAAPTGPAVKAKLDEAVDLITSLPRVAAERVQKLTIEGLSSGVRARETAKDIMKTGHVTASRAMLIARTETTRAATAMTEARAEFVGSEGYIWRTAEDSDVRPIHKKLNGKFIRWDDPPIAGEGGERAHAGAIYNCFLGDTLAGPIDRSLRILRAPFDGDLISLLVSNSTIETTPNHPILCGRGWIPAKDLQVGDQLASIPLKRFNSAVNYVNRFETLEEVFESYSSNRDSQFRSIVNLYGDIVDQEIEVVRTKLLLALKGDSYYLEQLKDVLITKANRWVRDSIDARRPQILKSSVSSLFRQVTAFWTGQSFHTQEVSFAATSPDDSLAPQNFSYRAPITVESHRQSQLTLAGEIKIDDLVLSPLVRKSSRRYKGHVYSLESIDGLFIITSAGVIVKNCRCYPEPIIPDQIA